MRVIAGRLKGMELKVAKGIRPTEGKVRKSLFDILGDSIIDMSFLDLFAGSGSVGFEAFSRGASGVSLVEFDYQAFVALKDNLSLIQANPHLAKEVSEKISVFHCDSSRAICDFHRRGSSFDFIFLDPPYYGQLAKKTLQTLSQYDIVTQFGLVIIQAHRRDELPDAHGEFKLYRKVDYKDTALFFYRKAI